MYGIVVYRPRNRFNELINMSPVTNISNIFYVPTQEIIDEISDDDENEQKVICFR